MTARCPGLGGSCRCEQLAGRPGDQNELDPTEQEFRQTAAYLVVDPDDSATTIAAAQSAARRSRRVVVCHPTPATTSSGQLWVDLLVGMGKTRAWISAPKTPTDGDVLGELVQVWLDAFEVRELIVLRADTLPIELWGELLGFANYRRRLWFVGTRAQPAVPWPTSSTRAPVRISARAFVAHWGCPHTAPVDNTPLAGTRPPDAAAHLRLFTLAADIRRLYPRHAEVLAALNHDLADARDYLARLQTAHLRHPHRGRSRSDAIDAQREWQPDPSRIADPASLAAVINAYMRLARADPDRAVIRLRALQLVLLEHGWHLHAPPEHTALDAAALGGVPTETMDRLNRLSDARHAGPLALAYSTGLPAATLTAIDAGDIAADGGEVVLDHRVWSLQPEAEPFARALRLVGTHRTTPAELTAELQKTAAVLGLPAPPLPELGGPEYPWFAGHRLTINRLPPATVCAPDPVAVSMRSSRYAEHTGALALEHRQWQ